MTGAADQKVNDMAFYGRMGVSIRRASGRAKCLLCSGLIAKGRACYVVYGQQEEHRLHINVSACRRNLKLWSLVQDEATALQKEIWETKGWTTKVTNDKIQLLEMRVKK
jgi:hypothetical protein